MSDIYITKLVFVLHVCVARATLHVCWTACAHMCVVFVCLDEMWSGLCIWDPTELLTNHFALVFIWVVYFLVDMFCFSLVEFQLSMLISKL